MGGRSRFDFEEGEKVHRNFSRLIHTLQHFPSKRSGLDTSSLWNLIEELESFNPDRKTKSMQFTQTTERKTYSKKCLNLRISNGNEKSAFVSASCNTGQKAKSGTSRDMFGEGSSSNRLKEKSFHTQKCPRTNNYSSKDDNFSNNFGTKKNNLTHKKDEVREKNLGGNLTSKSYYTPRVTQQKTNTVSQNRSKMSSLKDPMNSMDKNVSLNNKRWKTNYITKEGNTNKKFPAKKEINARVNRQKRNLTGDFKCKSHQCTPKPNKALQQIILDNSRSSMDKCSVVKKLTTYWNNLLNNEFEQCSSTSDSLEGSCQQVLSLDHLTRGVFNQSRTSSENSSSTLKSRHLSESNINIMKRLQDLDSKKFTDPTQASGTQLSNTTKYTTTDSDTVTSSVNDRYGQSTENEGQVSDYKLNVNLKENNQSSIISTKDVIEEIQKIVNTLKPFPNCNILSNEIPHPHTLHKKLLYVMVGSSRLNSQNETVFDKLEIHINRMIQEINQIKRDSKINQSKKTALKNELKDEISLDHNLSILTNSLETEMDYIIIDDKKRSKDKSSKYQEKSLALKSYKTDRFISALDECLIDTHQGIINSENSLVISRINLNKVKNALKLFVMWREIMWSKMPYNYDDFFFSNYESPPYHSFTIIYEDNIYFEEENSEKDDTSQFDSEDEYETNLDMFKSAAAKVESYIDRVIDMLENYCPDSPETFVRVIYQALVSILIWWVIAKEIFVN